MRLSRTQRLYGQVTAHRPCAQTYVQNKRTMSACARNPYAVAGIDEPLQTASTGLAADMAGVCDLGPYSFRQLVP